MSLTQRVLTDADIDQMFELFELVFAGEPIAQQERDIYGPRQGIDEGRGIGIFDDAELAGVGTLSALSVTVPGGILPLAGVMLIAVSPVYRRRGIMRRIIRHQLHSLHESGAEPLAGLTASESVIYGRFGYSTATYGANFTIPRDRAGLRPVAGADQVRLRLIPTAQSVDVCRAVQDRQAGQRAGMLIRPQAWVASDAADPDQFRHGRSELRTVLAERDGEAVGYARYRTRYERAANGVATGTVDVSEFFGDDAAAHAALLGYLTTIDLTGGTKFFQQAVDGPLVQLLADFRAAEMRMRDALYLRLVDVDRALAGRTYSAPLDVVLEITDELCPWNAGRWHLAGDEKSASCTRTSAPADLLLDVRELGAVYLGGTTLAALAQAALVTELRPEALTAASRAFATDLAPWLQFGI